MSDEFITIKIWKKTYRLLKVMAARSNQTIVDFLHDILTLNERYAVEYSKHSNDSGMFPFHIGELEKAIEGNLQDMVHDNRGDNKWQIVFVGSMDECAEFVQKLIKERPKDE